MNWDEAIKVVNQGKEVLFHHKGKVVPVTKNTMFQDLQWNHFGAFGLTWNDIINGKYSVA